MVNGKMTPQIGLLENRLSERRRRNVNGAIIITSFQKTSQRISTGIRTTSLKVNHSWHEPIKFFAIILN